MWPGALSQRRGPGPLTGSACPGPAWGPDRFGRGAILRYCRPIAPDEMEALIAEFRFAFVIPEETSDAEARRIRQDHYIDR